MQHWIYSITRPPVHKAYTYVLYNAVVVAHDYVYTNTMHTYRHIDNIYLQNGIRNISRENILLYSNSYMHSMLHLR